METIIIGAVTYTANVLGGLTMAALKALSQKYEFQSPIRKKK